MKNRNALEELGTHFATLAKIHTISNGIRLRLDKDNVPLLENEPRLLSTRCVLIHDLKSPEAPLFRFLEFPADSGVQYFLYCDEHGYSADSFGIARKHLVDSHFAEPEFLTREFCDEFVLYKFGFVVANCTPSDRVNNNRAYERSQAREWPLQSRLPASRTDIQQYLAHVTLQFGPTETLYVPSYKPITTDDLSRFADECVESFPRTLRLAVDKLLPGSGGDVIAPIINRSDLDKRGIGLYFCPFSKCMQGGIDPRNGRRQPFLRHCDFR